MISIALPYPLEFPVAYPSDLAGSVCCLGKVEYHRAAYNNGIPVHVRIETNSDRELRAFIPQMVGHGGIYNLGKNGIGNLCYVLIDTVSFVWNHLLCFEELAGFSGTAF